MPKRTTVVALLTLALSWPVLADVPSPIDGRTSRPPRPLNEQPVPQAKLEASQLLSLSAAALAKTTSYQFGGPASTSSGKTSVSITLSGAWQKPSQTYSKATVTASKVKKTGPVETYSDGSAVYVRVSGGAQLTGAATDQWVKTSQAPASQGNPFATLQVTSKAASSVTSGPDATVNGKTYWTLVAVLNEEAAKELLGSLLSAAGATTTATSGKTTVAATVTYYVDPQTYLSEIAKIEGSQTTTGSGGKKVTVNVKGDLTLSGVNQPVTMPDVSNAKTVSGTSRQP